MALLKISILRIINYICQTTIKNMMINNHTIDKLLNNISHDVNQAEKGYVDFELQKDIDWFGQTIPKGTVYVQCNDDHYTPIIGGNICPHQSLSFYTIKNNKEYFLSKNNTYYI